MHHWLISVPVAVVLVACAPATDSGDARLKADLVGSWRFEYVDEFERAVQGTFKLSEDGKFFGVEMVKVDQGLSEFRLSGLWYVTEGLFKLNTKTVDGRALGVQQQVFFTCKIVEFDAKRFSCRDDLAKKTYNYARVTNAS